VLPGRKYKIDDFLAIAWRRKWLIALPLAACTAGAYAIAKHMPDLYQSDTLILVVPQKVPETYVQSTVSGKIEDRLQSLKEQILSRSRLERIIFDLHLYPAERARQPLELVVEMMRSAIKVETAHGGNGFSVSYIARDPRQAQAVTERLAALFIEENVHDRERLAIGTSDFLQTQLDEARKRLIEQERKLEEYQLRYAGQLPSQSAFNLQAVQNGRLQLQNLENELARARERQLSLERQLAELLSSEPPPAPHTPVRAADANDDDPTQLAGSSPREQLEDARRKLAVLEERLKPEHPDIARLKRRIAQLERNTSAPVAARPSSVDPVRQRRADDIRADLAAVGREIAARQDEQRNVQDQIAMYQSRLDSAPIREAELTELTRDYDTLRQIYQSLLAKREDSKVAANLEERQVGEQFRVLDPARVAEQPFSPNRPRINLIGIAVGLLLGLGWTALLEYLDTTLKTEEDVRLLLGLPVIATIPILPERGEISPTLRARMGRWIAAARTGIALLASLVGITRGSA
jgi:polysaccharide chain length determinant protein (PEP-CTERM system associated)